MKSVLRSRLSLVVITNVLTLGLVGGAVAVGAVPSATGEISACYSNDTGALRVIDPEADQRCDDGVETPLSWRSGLVWRGAWDETATYTTGDAVFFKGSSYVAVAEVSKEPPSKSRAWELLAARGPTGAKGIDGVSGYEVVAGPWVSVEPNTSVARAEADCPADKRALGGGGNATHEIAPMMYSQPKAGGRGWAVKFRVDYGAPLQYAWSARAWVVCAVMS